MKAFQTIVPILFLLALLAHRLDAGDAGNAIDPSAHRAAIRARLLELTPLGEPLPQVVAVLNEKFASPDHASSIKVEVTSFSGDGPTKVIRIDLGEYLTAPLALTLPIPIPLIADTSATWIFDAKDRLADIAVSKKLTTEFNGK